MTSNNSELLANITRKAPWLLEEGKTFFPEIVPGESRQILNKVTDFDLVIITAQGRVFKQYLIMEIIEDRVVIDTPFEWDHSISSFHLFFRNKNNILNYFEVNGVSSDQEKISARIPKEICVLQKRRFERSLTPLGTKVIFRNQDKQIDFAFVHDISEGGMLLWTGDPKLRYPVDTTLQEIFIMLPTETLSSETDDSHRVLPYITHGKIVRAEVDQSSSVSRYGILFVHENIILYKRFNALIAKLKKQLSNRIISKNKLIYAYEHQNNRSLLHGT